MNPATPADGRVTFDTLRPAWEKLPPAMQDGIARTIMAAAGQQDALARPRRRHRHYDAAELTALRAQLIAILAVSPSLPNRVIAARLGLALSTFKSLKLNRFARQATLASAMPHSATFGYQGPRADEDQGDAETEPI